MKTSISLLLTMLITTFISSQPADLNYGFSLGNEEDDNIQRIDVDASDNSYIFGVFYDEMDIDPSNLENTIEALGSPDLFLAKYDTDGALQWGFNIGRLAQTNGVNVGDLEVTDAGDVYITGAFQNPVNFDPSGEADPLNPNGGKDVFLAKYNTDGEYQWAFNIGSIGFDAGTGLAMDENENIYLAARMTGEFNADPENGMGSHTSAGETDALLAKYASDGAYQWSTVIGTAMFDNINAITSDDAGNTFVGGYINSSTSGIPSYELFIASFDASGTEQWRYEMDNAGQNNQIHDIMLEDQSWIYVTGEFYEPTNFDPDGNAESITPNFQDVFLAKYTVEGDYEWAFRVQGFGPGDNGYALEMEGGDVILAGNFDQNADFDPSSDIELLNSEGERDIFLARYSTDMELDTVISIGGSSYEAVRDIVRTGDYELRVVGVFNGSFDLDPDEDETLVETNGEEDGFMASYNIEDTSTLPEKLEIESLKAFPNPASDRLDVQWTTHLKEPRVEIYDASGKIVYSKRMNEASRASLDITDIATGTYFLKLWDDTHEGMRTIVIQR